MAMQEGRFGPMIPPDALDALEMKLAEVRLYAHAMSRVKRRYFPSMGQSAEGAPEGLRLLSAEEKKILISHGNRFESENALLLVPQNWDASVDGVRIVNCVFLGATFLLGLFRRHTRHDELPGLYNSNLYDCVIEGDSRVSNCELVKLSYIGEGACLAGCGIVSRLGVMESPSSFGNGQEVPLVIGTGGRQSAIRLGMVFSSLCSQTVHRNSQVHEMNGQRDFSCGLNLFLSHSKACMCPHLSDVLLFDFGIIEASHVENSTIYSLKNEPSKVRAGSDVRDSILESLVTIDAQSIVRNSYMFKGSHVKNHGKLYNSVLGPCSGVAQGEINYSLVGPLVGFSHQALLIASFWPGGKGNVGHGANVGSNHTGKAPDQEAWHGEGVFYGLGSSVKFPSNFLHAPYSLIATGKTTLPQKVTMPFSLVSSSAEVLHDLSPALNEIRPGWVLDENLYMVFRNQYKYSERLDSKGCDWFVNTSVLRPWTILLMKKAKDELGTLGGSRIYTDKDLSGLGKNFLTEDNRIQAIRTYSFFMLFFAARELFLRWSFSSADVHSKQIPDTDYDELWHVKDTDFEILQPIDELRFRNAILRQEGPAHGITDGNILKTFLWLDEAMKEVLRRVTKSKEKDEIRGQRIIPGYLQAHGKAEKNDSVIGELRNEFYLVSARIQGLRNSQM